MLVQNRRWELHKFPFHYYYARDVFFPIVYREIEGAFSTILERGLSEKICEGRLSKSIPGYGAYSLSFTGEEQGPLALFHSKLWHDMLARLLHINATNDIVIELHHHPAGNPNGWVHSDLNPGWFIENHKSDGINVLNSARCDYRTGKTISPELIGRQTVRAAALLFYLGNQDWKCGAGGETGLYRGRNQRVDSPNVAIKPLNNSLIAFECTPYSFHSFLRNPTKPRNCLIMWLHRPHFEAVSRWSEHSFAHWPQ